MADKGLEDIEASKYTPNRRGACREAADSMGHTRGDEVAIEEGYEGA
jgi:hypothetical protein